MLDMTVALEDQVQKKRGRKPRFMNNTTEKVASTAEHKEERTEERQQTGSADMELTFVRTDRGYTSRGEHQASFGKGGQLYINTSTVEAFNVADYKFFRLAFNRKDKKSKTLFLLMTNEESKDKTTFPIRTTLSSKTAKAKLAAYVSLTSVFQRVADLGLMPGFLEKVLRYRVTKGSFKGDPMLILHPLDF